MSPLPDSEPLASAVAGLVAQVEALRGEVGKLRQRLNDFAPEDEVPEEHLAIMAAVFAQFLGTRVRVKSARALSAPNSWAQAGRVFLHAQRNVRQGPR